MRQRLMVLACLAVLALVGTGFAAEFNVNYMDGTVRSAGVDVQAEVEKALQISKRGADCPQVNVMVHDGYWMAVAYKAGSYDVDLYRLGVEDGKVTSVSTNQDDFEVDPAFQTTSTCPDTSVEVLISNFTGAQYPLAGGKTKEAAAALTAAGRKVVHLQNNDENLTAVKKYLACPKLKIWGRIGHGSAGSGGSIVLGDKINTFIYTRDLPAMAASWKGRIFPFNCCQIGGTRTPLMKNMVVNHGAIFSAAGNDLDLGAGPSEPFWCQFMIAVGGKTNGDLRTNAKTIFTKANQTAPGANGAAFGWYLPAGTEPLYAFPTVSIASKGVFATKQNVTVSVTGSTIKFNFPSAASTGIAVYNLSGRQCFTTTAQGSGYSMNASLVTPGTYIAVVKNETGLAEHTKFSVTQ